MQTPNPDIPTIPGTPELAAQLAGDVASPLVLLPVRLETRFFPMPDGSVELRVRVYPDQIHVDSHEPELTADELLWGQHFWVETWRAATDQARARSAWQQLADRFDAPRAAWIARALTPLNPADRPGAPLDQQALLTPPRFPAIGTKADAWTRAPLARALPARWIVLGYAGGRLVVSVTGSPIPADLPTGPDPLQSTDDSTPPDALVIDAGMQWMVDFDAAERVGMGIRITMSADDAAIGLDILLVMGVASDSGGAARLAQLFDAQHYTGGLSFVPQATPSNNTQDQPSGFRSSDPGHEASYLAERHADGSVGSGTNADLLGRALGLADAGPVFASLAHAADREQNGPRHMNTALWQTTWGYFLLQMLGVGASGESPLSDDDIAWARRHFIDYVRAGGPLPALRVGRQPYGVLPVTSLDAWQPAAASDDARREAALRNLLIDLRAIWRRSVADVPRLGRSDLTDPETGLDRDLAEVLSMDGLSSRYAIRNLIGRQYLEHLMIYLSADLFADIWGAVGETPQERIGLERLRRLRQRSFNEWWDTQERLTGNLLQALHLAWRPRLANGVFAPPVANLRGALVQAEPGPALAPNYIAALLAARSLNELRFETIQQPPPRALLYLLLRHAMLLEYTDAGSRLLIDRGLLTPAQRRELELVDLPLGQLSLTVWRQMATKISVSGVAEPIELGRYLLGFLPSGDPDTGREPSLGAIAEFRASLQQLQSLTVTALEQLMTGTLDLCSHRLDAWITSLATRRLDDLRRSTPSDVLIGGYGWLMNLRPSAQPTVTPPPGEVAPLVQSPANPGFVHTPSLAQAATVSILRSGHLAHAGGPQPNDLLAIDLSSERVRLAIWLLDGVRQGQPLGALLGYRFERRLQEAGAAQFIAFFREIAPLVARKREPGDQAAADQPLESIAANNVVDGLALQRLWQTARRNPTPGGPLIGLFATTAHRPPQDALQDARGVLEAELDALADSVDAVSDALLAESVHQVVRGNPLRAASTVEALAGGETPPPELEVTRTPRSGVALTHRLAVLFSGDPAAGTAWPGESPRALAEPHVNAWAARLLGDPARVRCIVERLDPATAQPVEVREIGLDRLGLPPIDLIYAVDGDAGQLAEIEQRMLLAVAQAGGFSPDALLRVGSARRSEWPASLLSWGEFSELLRAARRLLLGARAVSAADLIPPEHSAALEVDLVDLESRADTAETALRQLVGAFDAQLAAAEAISVDRLRALLRESAGFGIAGAVPAPATADQPGDRERLAAQVASVYRELSSRVARIMPPAGASGTLADQQRLDRALANLRAIFGRQFVVLPRFQATNAADLEQALADSTAVQDGDPLAATVWLQRASRVREGAGRLRDALLYAEALGSAERLDLRVAQLPYQPHDRWVGLPLGDDRPLSGGKVSLVVQSSAPLDPRLPLAGLLIDEWVEVVPGATETTGISFQYDQPNAAPPQSILLAVPPVIGQPWTIWSLQQVLLETLDLARIRAVDPDALGEIGHFLPAIFLSFNAAGHTVSTDFSTIR